jgi:hypothetical protein
MSVTAATPATADTAMDRALRRIIAELHDGLRHGYFEYTITCEVVTQARRRLTLHAGKSYQFVIPAQECEPRPIPPDSFDGGGPDDT